MKIRHFLLGLLSFLSQAILANDITDSLIQKLNNYVLQDTIKAELYQDLIWEFLWIDPNESIKYSDDLISLSKEINHKVGVSDGNSNKGTAYYYLAQYDSSLYYHNIALRISKEINDQVGIATHYNNMGMTYTAQNKYEDALNVWLKSIEIKEKLLAEDNTERNQRRLASAYGNIGSLFSNMERHEKSLEYIKKALEIFEKTNDTRGLSLSYGNMANGLKNLGDFNQSFGYYELAIKYARELESNFDISTQLFSYGETLAQTKKYSLAEEKINEALPLQKEIDDNAGIALSYVVLSGIKKAQNNKYLALKYGRESLQIAHAYKLVGHYDPIYENIVDLYKTYGMIDEAFTAFERKTYLKDSLIKIANESQLIELEAKYQNEAKQRTLDKQDKEILLTTAESNKQRVIIWGVSIGLIMIIAFSVIIWNRLRVSNTQKQIIQKKNKENELLLGEIHHRVKNNLQVISSLLSLQERNITDKTAKAAILDGKERVQSMGLIHKMLYQQNNFSGINMSEYIEKLIAGLLDSFGKNSDDFELNYDIKKINLDVDTAIPLGLIINELVVNALKHAYAVTKDPRININLQEINSQLVLQVEDNGKGEVADIQSSQSFGMKLVNSLSRQLSGTIELVQQDGLRFKIAINDYKLIA